MCHSPASDDRTGARFIVIALLMSLGVSGLARHAHAENLYLFEMQGPVLTAFGNVPAEFTGVMAGDMFSVKYTFDADAPDQSSLDYFGQYLDAITSFEITINGMSIFPLDNAVIEVFNDDPFSGGADQYNVAAGVGTPGLDPGAYIAGVTLSDSTGMVFNSTALPTTLNVNAFNGIFGIDGFSIFGADFTIAGPVSTIITQPVSMPPGSSQDNPVLPDESDGQGTFTFRDVPSGVWCDPPTAEGYVFEMLSDSLFTGILDFPTGFNSPFIVTANGMVVGMFEPGDSVDFTTLPGGGVESFTVTGIDPTLDPLDPQAFPIQLEFSTATADFTMSAILTPEPMGLMMMLGAGLLRLRRRETGAA